MVKHNSQDNNTLKSSYLEKAISKAIRNCVRTICGVRSKGDERMSRKRAAVFEPKASSAAPCPFRKSPRTQHQVNTNSEWLAIPIATKNNYSSPAVQQLRNKQTLTHITARQLIKKSTLPCTHSH